MGTLDHAIDVVCELYRVVGGADLGTACSVAAAVDADASVQHAACATRGAHVGLRTCCVRVFEYVRGRSKAKCGAYPIQATGVRVM